MNLRQFGVGVAYLSKAYQYDKFQKCRIAGNYIEALRSYGQLELARKVGQEIVQHPWGNSATDEVASTLHNIALVEASFKNYDYATQLLQRSLELQPDYQLSLKFLAEMFLENSIFNEAEKVITTGLSHYPQDWSLLFLLATCKHKQGKLDEALELYFAVEKANPTNYLIKSNIGAAFQALGKANEAIAYYQTALPHLPYDAGIRNNYGALLGVMNRKDEEIYWLKQALQIDPNMEQALVNLAGYYQDDGELLEARKLLQRALESTPKATLLELRIAIMVSPVYRSWQHMVAERIQIEENLHTLLNKSVIRPDSLDTALDRLHFYVVYHAINDRPFQVLVQKAYHAYVSDINIVLPRFQGLTLAKVQDSFSPVSGNSKKARVGFLSKFFGLFEPHGLLLDGVMKYLPRSHFEVVCLPVARTDVKPLSPSVEDACDEIYEVSLTYAHGFEIVARMNLDVLIFADTMGEPMAHFLLHNRMAPVQVQSLS